MTERARTVFFGSGGFAVPILDALAVAPETELLAVVSTPDRPAGRGAALASTPLVRRARELGLAILQPSRLRDPAIIASFADLRPALGVLADYGRIVPAELLDVPPRGILNVHPSLLPRWRGASPIAATIAAGDRETGATLMRMDAGLDTGPIVATERWELDGTETAPELEARAAEAGALLLRRTLGPWLRGELAPRPQDESEATMTRPLRRTDGRLDADRSAEASERQVRAYQPWPGSFVDGPAGRLIVWRAAVGRSSASDVNGTLVADDNGLALTTSEGRLRLIEVQPAGGRRMTGAELRRGRPGVLGPLTTG
jgi:methionyl-tRNA formyltransferase